MSVDFSQFFNGPIRDSLIAQVSGYLDISRQQATTAYDKAVALVIGAMARQAGKPEGAQALAAHIQNSQTQTSLTSSALSPTVLTNDQFAQIVTLGESEQAIILGPQQEAVTAHLEVATGLDRQAVGSLLSIVVPFVLSFLKNNITTEIAPAQSLPVLLATQAPHVAAQLDAPALAALGEDSLEGLFGSDALAAVDANTAVTSHNGKQGSAQGTMANEKSANGWFKWVLTLAVVLAGAAWIKSCTQSETANTENAKPADQQQSATDARAPDAATPATPEADTPAAKAGDEGKATEPAASTAPSVNFPAPDSTQSAGIADSPVAAESAQADSTKTESAQTEDADKPETPVAPATTSTTEKVPPAGEQAEGEQSQSASGQAGAPATDSAQPDAAATAAPESAAETASNGPTNGPTYGQASDTMEPEAQSDASTGAASTGAASSAVETTGADNNKSDQEPAPAAEGAEATTTAPDASSATAEQAGQSNAATDNTATANTTTDTTAPGKTTTFAEPAPVADEPDTSPSAQTPEPADAAGKTTTFAGSDSSDSQAKPVQPQEGSADSPADTQASPAAPSDGTAQSSAATESSGKTTTFGAAEQGAAASSSSPQIDSTAATVDSAGQTPVATEPAADSAQASAGSVAQIQLERDGDALRIRGTVPDEAARNRILSAAKFVDGHSKIEDELKVDSQAVASTFDDYSGLLSLLRGYHDVDVSLDKEALMLTGQVSSNEEKETLTAKIQNLVGANIQVNNQTEVVAPARAASPNSAAASATQPQVQFASGSAQVDSRFHDGLDQYAQQLKESGKSVRLVGFADESGSEPGNESLSKRRAESVKAYLILRGVQAQQIQTEGQGTQAPVADNTTEAGRARNRRVEMHEQ